MDIKTYYTSLNAEGKRAFAARMGTSTAYLSQLANNFRKPGFKTLAVIERATDGAVTRAELRPDLFGPEPLESKEDEAA